MSLASDTDSILTTNLMPIMESMDAQTNPEPALNTDGARNMIPQMKPQRNNNSRKATTQQNSNLGNGNLVLGYNTAGAFKAESSGGSDEDDDEDCWSSYGPVLLEGPTS